MLSADALLMVSQDAEPELAMRDPAAIEVAIQPGQFSQEGEVSEQSGITDSVSQTDSNSASNDLFDGLKTDLLAPEDPAQTAANLVPPVERIAPAQLEKSTVATDPRDGAPQSLSRVTVQVIQTADESASIAAASDLTSPV